MSMANGVEHPYQLHHLDLGISDADSPPETPTTLQTSQKRMEAEKESDQPMTVFIKLPAPMQLSPLHIL